MQRHRVIWVVTAIIVFATLLMTPSLFAQTPNHGQGVEDPDSAHTAKVKPGSEPRFDNRGPTSGAPSRQSESQNVQVSLVWVLLALAPWALSLAYFSAWDWLRPERRGEYFRFWGPVFAAALARWLLAPLLIATIFIGYRWTQQSIDLYPLPHYGAAGVTFYHWLLSLMPADHHTLMAANAVIGVFTLPLYGGFAARMYKDRHVGWMMMTLVAITPLFIRNATSDSNNIPMLWWLMGGVVNWLAYMSTGQRRSLFAAVVLLLLASMTRPEVVVYAVGLPFLCAWQGGNLRHILRDKWVWGALLIGAVLLVPHALHILAAIGELQARNSLPEMSMVEMTSRIVETFVHSNVLIEPRLYPAALWLCIFAAWQLKDQRRASIGLITASLVAIGILWSDVHWPNMARVEVPAAIFATTVGAAGAVQLFRQYSKYVVAAVIGFYIVSATYTGLILWQPTNEALEENLIQNAVSHLNQTNGATLVRTASQDRAGQSGHTHEHFPDYLLQPDVRPISVTQWMTAPQSATPVYFFWGMRCYAQFRRPADSRPVGDNLQAPCRLMRSKYSLEPVFERDVINYGDVWIEYYGDAKRFTVGLYKVTPKQGN